MDIFDSVLDKIKGLTASVTNAFEPAHADTKPTGKYSNQEVSDMMSAIGNNETGGVKGDRYSYSKFSGNEKMGKDMGYYQVTNGELNSWGKQFMKRKIDTKEWLSSPKLQNDYMRTKIKALAEEGATPQEIFALHRGGLSLYANPEVRKKKVKERQNYVNKAMNYYIKLRHKDMGFKG